MSTLPASSARDQPVELAPGVFWVGSGVGTGGLSCNPYLIVEDGEAVLIDGGSRPDFSRVMMKIMQAGVAPAAISTLIYQHHDPDLCGSIALLEEIIGRPDLRILSQTQNNAFIRFYGPRAQPECIDRLEGKLALRSGRVLRFVATPYAHTPGSFMTFDEQSGILFTSDLLGSYAGGPLLAQLGDDAEEELRLLDEFHRVVMPSARALRLACDRILSVPARTFAPQHGHVWTRRADVERIVARLRALADVGIDGVAEAQ